MELVRLEVFEQEAVAAGVLDVRPQSAAHQDGANDGLEETEHLIGSDGGNVLAEPSQISSLALVGAQSDL